MYSGLTVPPSLLALADEVMNNDPFLLHCMSPLLARSCRSGMSALRSVMGAKRKTFARSELYWF
jgi:hypothetical protein